MTSKIVNANPDPSNYTIVRTTRIGKYTILKVRYNDCINYEGLKIMFWKTKDFNKMHSKKVLDPHFSEQVPSCIARFEPTKEGWDMALKLARSL